jgi:hypothetical protein
MLIVGATRRCRTAHRLVVGVAVLRLDWLDVHHSLCTVVEGKAKAKAKQSKASGGKVRWGDKGFEVDVFVLEVKKKKTSIDQNQVEQGAKPRSRLMSVSG